MARVRLRVWENNPSLQLPARDASLPFLRVVATVLLGLDPPPGEVVHRYDATAAIDTGAPFSIIKCGTCERMVTAERKTNRHGSTYVYYHCSARSIQN